MGRGNKRITTFEQIFTIWLSMLIWSSILIFFIWVGKMIYRIFI